MSSMSTRYLLGLFLVVGVAGCVTTNPRESMMDPYDPRNSIPLLPAATRASGANVPQAEVKPSVASAGRVIANNDVPNPSAQKLREIKALKDEGILTQKEYDAKKSEILKGM